MSYIKFLSLLEKYFTFLCETDDPDVNENSGTRFGNVKFSRHEYNTLPGRHRQKSELSVEFKTSEPDGIIFYAAENRHIDYTALYLKDGKVCGL